MKKSTLDIEVTVELSLDEMYSGVKKRISYSRTDPCTCEEVKGCKICSGSRVLQKVVSEMVEFPVGVSKDHVLKLRGKGNHRRKKDLVSMLAKLLKKHPNGDIGDLHITILEKKNEYFERSDLDLIYRCEVDESLLAVTDVTVELHHLSGEDMKIKIPQHLEKGRVLRVKGYGFKSMKSGEYGDLIINIKRV